MEKRIHPLLDERLQEKAKAYEKERRKISLWGSIISSFFNLFFYFSGLSGKIAHSKVFSSVFILFVIYLLIYGITQDLITFPLSYISGFIIEKKFGFLKQSKKEWLKDHLKSFLISLIFSILIFGALLIIFEKFESLWWLVASSFMLLFSIAVSIVFPIWIMPIFHKYELIEDEELKKSLKEILEKGGLKFRGFFKEDTSRKTTKENAMLAGLGKTKRVILTDNLINNMKIDEIKAVLAHEVGHYKRAHIPKIIFTGLFFNLFSFYILHLTFSYFFPTFLKGFRDNIALLPMFLLFLSLIDLVFLKILQNFLLRLFEIQADKEALNLTEDPEAFKRAMAGLANRNLSNAYPGFLVKLIYYTHPPIGERLEMAEEFQKGR
ncbi:MAG: M48 family metallopeptidase [candidate division WOR-3 bacterium]